MFAHGKNYVCERSVPTDAQPAPSCDFRSGQVILQQPVAREQMAKLLASGKTDLLDKFVSMRTRRPFKAMLAWDAEAGKVGFEFAPSKFPPRKTAGAGARPAAAAKTAAAKTPAKVPTAKTPAGKAAVKKAPAKKVPAKKAAAKSESTRAAASKRAAAPAKTATPRTGSLQPSAALAAVIGPGPFARTEVVKKLWDYIKAKGLQDAKDKRSIVPDAPLKAVFGKPKVTMFEVAGLIGPHLS